MAQTFEGIMKYPAADKEMAGKAMEEAVRIVRADLGELVKVKMVRVAIAGFPKGNTIFLKIPNSLSPSILAASHSSSGMLM
mgnify:CR=1 FL=1